jgi:hypothetical protein
MNAVDHAEFAAPVALVVDLLDWVATRPRSYRDTMDAWRTSCPRLPVWEDALGNALVAVAPDDRGDLAVTLTAKGQDFLARRPR